VVAIGPQGLNLLLKVEATNPNSFTLSAEAVTAKARLDNRFDMGAVSITQAIVLPPNIPTMIDVPMTMPWTDVKGLALLASTPKPVPYVVEGKVKIGGERLNVDVPFSIPGTISRDQIIAAAAKGLPGFPALAPQ
jgi:LEA14-like dessication related protein